MLRRTFDRSHLIDQCSISLSNLCSGTEQTKLLGRVHAFIASDSSLQKIASCTGDSLTYESESFVPNHFDPHKPSLFLVAGNPAPHSIAQRAMYAYEGSGTRQHRFWKVLHRSGVLRFSAADPDAHPPEEKMRRLFAGDFTSAFNIRIIPFFSLASPPGGPWSGVSGLQRVFGRSFPELVRAELAAVNDLLGELGKPGDTVVVMQKDAYMAMKSPGAAPYDAEVLRVAPISTTTTVHGLDLLCIPPTRLMYSRVTMATLASL
jgi:hypothetical protein